MFGRNRSAVVERLPSVEDVQNLLREINERADDLAKLQRGLSTMTQESETLVVEEATQREAMDRAAMRALYKPEEQREAEYCHERMLAAQARRAELQRQTAALNGEIQRVEKDLERLRTELERGLRQAWEDILDVLVKQFSEEQREHFLITWTALDQRYNGVPSLGVIQRFGIPSGLDTDTKLRMLNKLSDVYGMLQH